MKQERYKAYEITSAGGSDSVKIGSNEQNIAVYSDGSVTLTSGYTLSFTGTPSQGMNLTVWYFADATLNGNTITILGESISADESSKALKIEFYYHSAGWEVVKLTDIDDISVDPDDFADGSIASSKLNGVDVDKINLTDPQYFIRGAASGGVEEKVSNNEVISSLSGELGAWPADGDLTMTVTEPAGLGTGYKATYRIKDDAVDNDALNDMARGTVKYGNSSGNPDDLDCSDDGAIPCGDGTDVAAMTLSSDVDAATNGSNLNVSVRKGSYQSTEDVYGGDVYNGVPIKIVIPVDEALLDGTTNDLHALGPQDIITDATFHISSTTCSSSEKIDVGVDAAFTGAGANSDAILDDIDTTTNGRTNVSGTVLANNGYLRGALSLSYVTITASTDISSETVSAVLVLEVLKA